MAFSQRHYDYIIGGAGCAGLSLAWHISKRIPDVNLLIIGPPESVEDEKTWCFWSLDSVPEPVKPDYSWEQVEVFAGSSHICEKPGNLKYHCLHSSSYHKAIRADLKNKPGIDWLEEPVEGTGETGKSVNIQAGGKSYSCSHYFKCYGQPDALRSRFFLKQHFKGVEVHTSKPFFDTGKARMMDFRVEQLGGATFFYVLPFSETRALVEYTLFSPKLLDPEQYDSAIGTYINKQLGLESGSYSLGRSEFGVIPMADHLFDPGRGSRIHNCGTASGIPKASTGYAFSRIQRQSNRVAAQLAAGQKPRIPNPSSARFRIYDLMMLDILSENQELIVEVFEALFTRNPVERVLRFIDEQTSFTEDLRVMASVPRLPFLRAGFRNAELIMKGAG